jgi:predicted GNAT superfamily acetyltransferase
MPEIRILQTAEEMAQVEDLQRLVWPGSETEILPAHLLLTIAHNGGLVLGAFEEQTMMVGLLVGFPGLYDLPDGPQPKHCSHELGVHPDYRNAGIGFALKRAQWQMVRQQGLNLVTWTYDPLLSRNAYLNIARLGAVCNTYLPNYYGTMRDGLNSGLDSDRFQVDWWLNTRRVSQRMGKHPRPGLTLEHYTSAATQPLYQTAANAGGLPVPPGNFDRPQESLALVEIPSDFLALKAQDFDLARAWRAFSREVFSTCFGEKYLVSDFIFDRSGGRPRSFYVLVHEESTLHIQI